MKLSKERAIQMHRRMWKWIALKSRKEKRCIYKDEFPYFKNERIRDLCFCCEYADQTRPNVCADLHRICMYCPINWGSNRSCSEDHGLFEKWIGAIRDNRWRKAARIAMKISKLPERKGEI